ncbi:MAG: hypothetical protein IKU11_04620, partial [Clostridia bacterium]|nr:hypothetical protein [Clostridia bacterium]
MTIINNGAAPPGGFPLLFSLHYSLFFSPSGFADPLWGSTLTHGRMSIKCNRISQNFNWSFPAKTLPGTVIDQIFNDLNILISNRPEIET